MVPAAPTPAWQAVRPVTSASGNKKGPRTNRSRWPTTRRRRAAALAAALLQAKAEEAELWHVADPRHRAGILDGLGRAYQAIAANYDLAGLPPGLEEGTTGAQPYIGLAQLAGLLRDTERRLALGGPAALPLTWYQIPDYIRQLDDAERDAWTRFFLSPSRAERSQLLRGTLSATAAARLGSQAAAFLTVAGWSEHATSASQDPTEGLRPGHPADHRPTPTAQPGRAGPGRRAGL